jgi:hypothetical protein
MQVPARSPPTIVATCIDSAEERLGPLPAPPPALMGEDRCRYCEGHLPWPPSANASAREAAQPLVETSCPRTLLSAEMNAETLPTQSQC